ncbi:MAG: dienelactone hydrolase family protein [Caldilineaceae bacterium]|nr:dienelactone hydrolase family protein [Caldilineaceae bacterium]
MRRIGSRSRFVIILSVVALVLVAGWYDGPVRQAVLLTTDLVLQPSFSVLAPFKSKIVPTVVEIPYDEGMMMTTATILYPVGVENGGGVILAPGYLPTMSDPLLDRLAQDLAQMGFFVLIPKTARLRQGLVTPEDVEVLVAAFLWLSEQPGINPESIGFAGFCIGGSLAMVAAADSRINERVSYINIFGGYFDARSAFRSIGTHTMILSDRTTPWQPAPQAVALYLQNVLMHIEDDTSRKQIEYALQENQSIDIAALRPDVRRIYQVLAASTPSEMERRLSELSEDKLAYFAAISPSHAISQLKARVFVMHDIADPYMPVSESYQLAEAIPPSTEVVITRFQLFNHVHPSGVLGRAILAKESVKLMWHLSRLFDVMTP